MMLIVNHSVVEMIGPRLPGFHSSKLCGCSTTRLSSPIKGFRESVSNICLVPGVL